ncbi:MAG TPA: response regulator, partial [Agitococcus sp.]|nr:response regulator [Agitococcus sp.]HNG47787.1 response regulator [Agitococcus sp.]HNN29478.1 response regulator [Agitococcus sp.]
MKSDRILIVDDEAAIREMISIALDLAGFDTIEAEDALQAHHKIVDERPSLVLLDWMLPGMTGIELCRRLKR